MLDTIGTYSGHQINQFYGEYICYLFIFLRVFKGLLFILFDYIYLEEAYKEYIYILDR